MIRLKRKLVKCKPLIWLYDIKNYFEVGTEVVGFVTNKLPLIMSLYYFYQNKEFIVQNPFILIIVVIGFGCIALLGTFWTRIGFYDIERYSEARIHPVTRELLQAARKINNGK